MAVADHFDTVQNIYIAFYQRPADPAGLRYWAERVEVAGGDTAAVIDAFANSEEAQELYGDITDANIGETVTAIYQALFGRAPDAAGLAFYEEAFANGELSAGTIALQILDGARGDDVIALNNKLAVANEFTAQVAGQELTDANFGQGGNFAITYDAEDVEAAREILAGVTAAPGSVLTPAAVAEALQEQIANEGEVIGGSGSTFTLTTTAGENIQGTSGNDTFNVLIGTGETLNTFDQINGGAGTDTLNIIAAGTWSVPASAKISSVENVNIAVGEDVNGSAVVNASVFGGATAIRQTGAIALDVEGLTTGQQVVFTDAVANVAYATGAAAASVQLDGADNAETLNVDGIDLTSLNVTGSIEAAEGGATRSLTITTTSENTATTANDGSNIATVTVSLSSAVNLNVSDLTETVTFNAAGTTGAVTTDLSALADLESATFGAGSDDVTFALGNANVTLNAGAGADLVTLSGINSEDVEEAVSATITLGAGNDTFVLSAGGNLSNDADTVEEIEASLISITDFARGEDVIQFFGGFSGFAAQAGVDGVNAAIADAQSLADAIDALRDTDFGTAQFVYDGNLYLFANAEGNDTLVELTGVNTLLTADNVTAADLG